MNKAKNNQLLNFDDFKIELLKDPEVKKEYDRLQPEYAMISAVIKARVKRGFTQKILAERTGTKQSVISRLESGRANPSVSFLKKLAIAMGTHLEIQFV
jgi:ribosome-binding protein aMBF1 (putative translation factor)